MSGVYAWSPRGHQLAIAGFCCTDSQRGGVYVVDAGTGTRRVVAPGSEVPTIAWAPDGRTLGYTSAPISGDLSRAGVWTVAGRGGTPRRVTDGLLVMWSPDARSLLVNGRNDLALVGIDGGDRRRLTSTANLGGDYPSTWAAFSPDGDAIAVVGNGANTLVVCRSDGSSCANVAGVHAPPIAGLSFSPDGKRITYVADGALWIVDGDSADAQVHQAELAPRRLDDLGRDLLQGAGDGVHITRGTAPNAPVWLGDGTILYHHGAQLRVVDPDGGPSTTIANPIGFSDAGAKDQGLPGGQPIAEWQLTTRPS
jgi:Tol biopolymer transport system component